MLFTANTSLAAEIDGYGDLKFGMTREQVKEAYSESSSEECLPFVFHEKECIKIVEQEYFGEKASIELRFKKETQTLSRIKYLIPIYVPSDVCEQKFQDLLAKIKEGNPELQLSSVSITAMPQEFYDDGKGNKITVFRECNLPNDKGLLSFTYSHQH